MQRLLVLRVQRLLSTMRRAHLLCALLVGSALALPSGASAQSGARLLVEISPTLLAPAEDEPIACTRRRAQEDLQVQRQPMGRFAARTGEFNPTIWAVTLVNSGRWIVIEAETGYQPREVTIIAARSRRDGRLQENVRVRFLNAGVVQDGQRAVSAPSAMPGGAPPATSPLDSLDGPQLYALSRELLFRCERGITMPVPSGSIQGQIPPN
jgi:hypothetical protein